MGKYPDSVNKYNHTPRKVFDKYTEKIERKMALAKHDLLILEKAIIGLQDARLRSQLDIENLEEHIEELEFQVRLGKKGAQTEEDRG